MQTTSPFDPKTFLEQTFKGNLDTTYVLPDEGDYTAQVADVKLRSGTVGVDKARAGEPWLTADLIWELVGPEADEVKKKMNVERAQARQSLMLDLLVDNGRVTGLDFGTNRNMRLRRLLDATGLNNNKQWNFASLKHATAYVTVKHNKPEGFDDPIAEVTRITSLAKAAEKGRAA